MKNFILILIFLTGFFAFGQEKNKNTEMHKREKMHKEHQEMHKKRKEMMEEINKNIKNLKADMSPEERKNTLRKIKIDLLIKELQVPKEKQSRASRLFDEYFQNHDNIMKEYKNHKKDENISDEEARKKIKQGLEAAQKLLDNRKSSTEKFLEVLTPHQVLKVYKMEKEIFSQLKHRHHQKEKQTR